MPIYKYTAYDIHGERCVGFQAALSRSELVKQLSADGLVLENANQQWRISGKGLRAEMFLLFCKELIALLRAGLTLPNAIENCAKRPEGDELGLSLKSIHHDIHSGQSFSEACEKQPHLYDPLFLATIKTGEKSGNLVDVLMEYEKYLTKQIALRRHIGQALTYPVFLLLTMTLILAALFIFVLPQFISMYADFDATLPFPTRALIGIVNSLYVAIPVFIFSGIIIAIVFRKYLNTETGIHNWYKLRSKLPYIGMLDLLTNTIQISRSMSTLLRSGIPLVDSLGITSKAINNAFYALKINVLQDDILGGNTLTDTCRTNKLFPDTALRMIATGEASGSLDYIFSEIATYYDELLQVRLSRALSLLEPVMMLLMGIIVGGIIISMYLPIFSLAEVIK